MAPNLTARVPRAGAWAQRAGAREAATPLGPPAQNLSLSPKTHYSDGRRERRAAGRLGHLGPRGRQGLASSRPREPRAHRWRRAGQNARVHGAARVRAEAAARRLRCAAAPTPRHRRPAPTPCTAPPSAESAPSGAGRVRRRGDLPGGAARAGGAARGGGEEVRRVARPEVRAAARAARSPRARALPALSSHALTPHAAQLDKLEPRRLLALVESILTSLSATLRAGSDGTKPLALLPKALNVLSTLDKVSLCAADGTELPDGDAGVKYALGRLVKAPWPAAAMVMLATVVRDIEVPRAALGDLVVKVRCSTSPSRRRPACSTSPYSQARRSRRCSATWAPLRAVARRRHRPRRRPRRPGRRLRPHPARGGARRRAGRSHAQARQEWRDIAHALLAPMLSVARIPRFDAPSPPASSAPSAASSPPGTRRRPRLAEAAALCLSRRAPCCSRTVRASAAAGRGPPRPSIVRSRRRSSTPPPKATKSSSPLSPTPTTPTPPTTARPAGGAAAGGGADGGARPLAEAFRLHEGVRAEALELTFSDRLSVGGEPGVGVVLQPSSSRSRWCCCSTRR